MSLLVHGVEIGADSAEILRADERAKAAGDFLLHLGHTDGALAQVVGKRHPQIGDEAQHLCGVFAHAPHQIERLRLFDPTTALVVLDGMRVMAMSVEQDRLVVREDPPYLPRTERRSVVLSRRLTECMGTGEQPHHSFGPALSGGFVQKRQFAQQVCIAQGVLAIELPIWSPAIVHQRPNSLGQDAMLGA